MAVTVSTFCTGSIYVQFPILQMPVVAVYERLAGSIVINGDKIKIPNNNYTIVTLMITLKRKTCAEKDSFPVGVAF